MPSKRDRNNLKASQTKRQSFKSTPASLATSNKYNNEQSIQNANGYLQIKLGEAQVECIDVIRNNIITFVEGPARNW